MLQGRHSPSPLKRPGHGNGRWRKRVSFFEEEYRENEGSAQFVVTLMACCEGSSFESNPLRFGWKADRNVCPTRQVDQPEAGGSTRRRWINQTKADQQEIDGSTRGMLGKGKRGKEKGVRGSICRSADGSLSTVQQSVQAPRSVGSRFRLSAKHSPQVLGMFVRTRPVLTIERRPLSYPQLF